MWRIWLAVILVCCTTASRAETLTINDLQSVALDSFVQYVEDPQGYDTIDVVRQPDFQWQQNSADAFNKGYSASVWWLKLSIQNPEATPVTRYVELAYAVLDYVDIYVYSDDHQLIHYQLGDMQPFYKRPIENRFFVIPLHWQTGEKLDIFYRIKTSTSVQAPLMLWQRDAFEQRENTSNIAQGFYYGAMAVIAVYNLLIFFVLWERSYLFYVLFVASLPMFMACISGQAYRFLWPESVTWNDHAIPFFLGLAFASSMLFAQRFLQVKEWSPWLSRVLTGGSVAALSCVALSFVLPYYMVIHLLVPLGLFACVYAMVIGVLALRTHVPNARFYVLAWLSFLLGGVMLALNKLNVLPTNMLTEYSIQVGSMLEAVLLSFAMAERINVERRLRFEAQDETLQATRRLNEQLELRVLERTQELEVLNARLQELSNTDPLTQLKNRRYLDQVLEEEWSRCKRYHRDIAVLMIDVDFFKNVNDQYGHHAGDDCLKQVAERISACIRWPSDQVARFGGEEFCMILPETDVDGAVTLAERIREKIQAQPIDTTAGQFTITASIGIWAGIPSEQNNVEYLTRCADLALYQSKQAGRNQVTLFRSGQHSNVEPLVKVKPTSGHNRQER